MVHELLDRNITYSSIRGRGEGVVGVICLLRNQIELHIYSTADIYYNHDNCRACLIYTYLHISVMRPGYGFFK